MCVQRFRWREFPVEAGSTCRDCWFALLYKGYAQFKRSLDSLSSAANDKYIRRFALHENALLLYTTDQWHHPCNEIKVKN
jgi:hypothetical protein